MPKINAKLKAQTEAAEEQDFSPLKPGVYVVRILKDFEVGAGPAGPYWKAEFTVMGPTGARRKLWKNLSHSEKAAGIMKSFLKALPAGADECEDTEDWVGMTLRVQVIQKTQEQGAGAGNLINEIQSFLKKDEDAEAALMADVDSAEEDDPLAGLDDEPVAVAAAGTRRSRREAAAADPLFEE